MNDSDAAASTPVSPNPDAPYPVTTTRLPISSVHSGSAVCTPTRYGVLTGRYCWRSRLKSGVLSGYSKSLIEPGRATVASLLKSGGYRTGCVGKWHLGLDWATKNEPEDNPNWDSKGFAVPEGLDIDYRYHLRRGPNDFGFDYSYIFPASLDMAPYVYVENNKPVADADDRTEGFRDGGTFWREGPMMKGFDFTDVLPHLTSKVADFIDDHAANHSGSPFFLYFPLTAPHWPWLPTDDVRGKSGAGKYGDFVVEVDNMVGRVMETLDRNGLAGNTLFILTSDNGAEWDPSHIEEFGHQANHPDLRGKKRDAWDGGHRIPFIARWPGKIAAGSTSDQTICLTDLSATATAIAGVSLPNDAAEDSYNILPALRGEAAGPIREATVHHSADGMFAIRQGKWKLVDGQGPGSGNYGPWKAKPGDSAGQLYDMTGDTSERANVYNDHPEVVEQLKTLLEKYKEQGYSRPMGG
jgi:arylsulfatase A-like enzyme